MNILGIDTATNWLGVIARKGDETCLLSANAGFRHGEQLIDWIEKVLASLALEAKRLDLIVCSRGPGSFTGLRIGLAAAKGMALAVGCPVTGISSLDVFGARYAAFPGAVIPVIDARKSRFYAAVYNGGRRETDYLDAAPDEVRSLAARAGRVLFTGPDADRIFPPAAAPDGVSIIPSHQELPTLLCLGLKAFQEHGGLPDGAGPLYVRPSEAELSKRGPSGAPTEPALDVPSGA